MNGQGREGPARVSLLDLRRGVVCPNLIARSAGIQCVVAWLLSLLTRDNVWCIVPSYRCSKHGTLVLEQLLVLQCRRVCEAGQGVLGGDAGLSCLCQQRAAGDVCGLDDSQLHHQCTSAAVLAWLGLGGLVD